MAGCPLLLVGCSVHVHCKKEMLLLTGLGVTYYAGVDSCGFIATDIHFCIWICVGLVLLSWNNVSNTGYDLNISAGVCYIFDYISYTSYV